MTRMVKYQVQKCYGSVIAGVAILALDKIYYKEDGDRQGAAALRARELGQGSS